jgi:hypothetical protein
LDQHPGSPTSSIPYAGDPVPPATGPEALAKQKNSLGRVALSVSIIGFVFGCVPEALIVGWVLLPIAFILGIAGLFLSGKAKGASIAGVIISVVGIVIGVAVFCTLATDEFDDAFGASHSIFTGIEV